MLHQHFIFLAPKSLEKFKNILVLWKKRTSALILTRSNVLPASI